MDIRITCIRRAAGDHENPYVAITHLGWMDASKVETIIVTRETMYQWIEEKRVKAYVQDDKGNIAFLKTAISPRGTKYVKTTADHIKADNLLSLEECHKK